LALLADAIRYRVSRGRKAEHDKCAFILQWLRAALEHDAQTRPHPKITLPTIRSLALLDVEPLRAAKEIILQFSDHAPRRWHSVDDQAMTKAA
jgi:hypothetical protein